MSDLQKIWFIYLTDHHEGPFTPAEVGVKAKEGLVTPQSLGWKDGMAEWLPLESIPELSGVFHSAPSAAPALAVADAAPAGGEESFSLAQLLASQQQGSPPEASGGVNLNFETASPSLAASSVAVAAEETPVGPNDEVWTLKIGTQVSGLHSLQRLKTLAAEGEVPADAMLWRGGWSDFRPVSAVPEVASARKARKSGTSPGFTAPAKNKRPGGIAPLTAAANIGNDEATDPGLIRPAKTGFIQKISKFFAKKKAPIAAAALQARKPIYAAKKSGGFQRVLMLVLGIALVGGAGAAYFLLFSSPIPSDLDVIADDLEAMQEVVKAPASDKKLHLALARGTDENPADDTAPKFYVATNLPEGTVLTLTVTGQPGTLVNRINFQKSYVANVNKQKLAVFERVDDDSKPLPMGEYDLKVTGEGVEPFLLSRFLGGKKGGPYVDRLKRYKEKLQGEYDKEMQELREYIDTLKSMQADMAKRNGEFKAATVPTTKAKIVSDWKTYVANANNLVAQLEQKLKARSANAAQGFHPKAFQDSAHAVDQVKQLLVLQSQRFDGATVNVEDLEAQVLMSVAALDQWLAQALVKSPFEVLQPSATPAK